MQTHEVKRVKITIEAMMQRRLTCALREAGVTGYAIPPVLGGSGRSGDLARAGQVGRAEGMVQVVCIIRPDKLDTRLGAAFAVVEKHIGVVCVTDSTMLRVERFLIHLLLRLAARYSLADRKDVNADAVSACEFGTMSVRSRWAPRAITGRDFW